MEFDEMSARLFETGSNIRNSDKECIAGEEKPWDRFVMILGKLGFISAFSFFPVDYVDESIAVFNFPPLRSFIAVHNISRQPDT